MTKTLFINCKTTGTNETVGIPLGPASYVGGGALRLKIYWGEDDSLYTVYTDNHYETFKVLGGGLSDQSQEEGSYSNSSHWAPTNTYSSPGTYKIKIYGGVGADSNFDGGKIAFSQTSEHDNDGTASINNLRDANSTPEAFTNIRYAGGLYIHGQGDFNGFTNLGVAGKLKQATMLKSNDPSDAIIDSASNGATLFMDHTFKDCENLRYKTAGKIGIKMGDSIRSAQGTFMGSNFNGNLSKWNLNKVTSIKNLFKDAVNFKGKGLAKLFRVANLLEVAEGAFQGCAALVGKGVKNWNVANVVNIKNLFKDARVNNVNVKKWNVANVTISTGFGITGSNAPQTATANGTSLQTGTTSSNFTLPDNITVTQADLNADFGSNEETPVGDYTKQSAIEFENGTGELWNGVFESVSAGELGGETLTYYEQSESDSGSEWKYWIVIGSDQDLFALAQVQSIDDFETIDGADAQDASVSLLNWSGSDTPGQDNAQNSYINVADAD